MKRIYIAGAYSADNVLSVLDNIRKGIRVGTELLLKGYYPFIPWLDYNVFLQLRDNENISVETIKEHSIAWLEVSDAVLVLSNWENSKGTIAEIARAKELNIPVYYSIEEMQ
jgi:hypothetical protein